MFILCLNAFLRTMQGFCQQSILNSALELNLTAQLDVDLPAV